MKRLEDIEQLMNETFGLAEKYRRASEAYTSATGAVPVDEYEQLTKDSRQTSDKLLYHLIAHRGKNILALLAHCRKLEEAVARLPKTKDGVIPWPGTSIFKTSSYTNYIFEGVVEEWSWEKSNEDRPAEWWIRTENPRMWSNPAAWCYSTREAAERAVGKGEGQQ